MYGVPFSSDELRTIADYVQIAEENLSGFLNEAGFDLREGINDVRVEIYRPDDDSQEVVGEVRWHPDGWFGYYPKDVEA